jgi:dolichol kinase/4-hydroxybenzoate polyprenyltransferase
MSAGLGVAFSVSFLTSLMFLVAGLRRRMALSSEVARKMVHVGSGALALSFPWLFANSTSVLVVCSASAIFLAVARYTHALPPRLSDALNSVQRGSGGEFYFPLAIGLLYLFAQGELALYLIPASVLTLSDAAAALIGSRWGVTHYHALRGKKSIEGSLAFFVVTLALSYTLLLRLTGLSSGHALALALSISVATTLTEAIASGGSDNVAVPLVALLFLSTSMGAHPFASWVQGSISAALAFTLLWIQRRRRTGNRPDYVGRMRVYLSEMFPLPLRALTAAAYFLGVASMIRLLLGLHTSLWTAYTALGIWTLFCHMLLLRLMDELKDVEVDRKLFPERPVPSGRVSTADISTGLALASVLFLVPNLSVPMALLAGSMLLAYSFLMFRFFFVPNLLRRNLLLNLATHNPVVAVALVYTIAVVAAEHGLEATGIDLRTAGLLIAFFWPATLAWEIARKIRSREEEDSYVTYSQIFGRRRAVFLVAGIQAVTALVGIYFYLSHSLSALFPLLLLLAYAAALVGPVRFLLRPSPATSRQRCWAEAFLFGVFVSALAEFSLGQHFHRM